MFFPLVQVPKASIWTLRIYSRENWWEIRCRLDIDIDIVVAWTNEDMKCTMYKWNERTLTNSSNTWSFRRTLLLVGVLCSLVAATGIFLVYSSQIERMWLFEVVAWDQMNTVLRVRHILNSGIWWRIASVLRTFKNLSAVCCSLLFLEIAAKYSRKFLVLFKSARRLPA